jgi:hypothetical protein
MVQVLTHFQVIIILHDGPTTAVNSEIIICISKIFSLSIVVHSPQTDLLIFGVWGLGGQKLVAEFSSRR